MQIPILKSYVQGSATGCNPGCNLLSCNSLVAVPSLVADLGLSVSAEQEPSSIVGVIPYIAPEVLSGKPHTQKSDIYSFGILMSVISTGQQPFNDKAL